MATMGALFLFLGSWRGEGEGLKAAIILFLFCFILF
jgi:hypothetical protein